MAGGRPRKNELQTIIDGLRNQAWLTCLHREYEKDFPTGVASDRSIRVALREWLNSRCTEVVPENSGKIEKWFAGTHAPSKSTLNLIEQHVRGSKQVWINGPGNSHLFEALLSSYEDLWAITGLTRKSLAEYVASGQGRFSDNINNLFSNLYGDHTPIQLLARFVAIWRIIWMSLHSWQEVESHLTAYLQDETTRAMLEESGICIRHLCIVLDMLRREYTWATDQEETIFGKYSYTGGWVDSIAPRL